MSDATLYSDEMFVLLVPGDDEVFLSADEMLERLRVLLADYQDDLPRDLQNISSLEEQAKSLRDTSCEFEVSPGINWQWYAVRLEK